MTFFSKKSIDQDLDRLIPCLFFPFASYGLVFFKHYNLLFPSEVVAILKTNYLRACHYIRLCDFFSNF